MKNNLFQIPKRRKKKLKKPMKNNTLQVELLSQFYNFL